ncbi:spermatogenesis associated protein 5 [Conglomerata obtusa]
MSLQYTTTSFYNETITNTFKTQLANPIGLYIIKNEPNALTRFELLIEPSHDHTLSRSMIRLGSGFRKTYKINSSTTVRLEPYKRQVKEASVIVLSDYTENIKTLKELSYVKKGMVFDNFFICDIIGDGVDTNKRIYNFYYKINNDTRIFFKPHDDVYQLKNQEKNLERILYTPLMHNDILYKYNIRKSNFYIVDGDLGMYLNSFVKKVCYNLYVNYFEYNLENDEIDHFKKFYKKIVDFKPVVIALTNFSSKRKEFVSEIKTIARIDDAKFGSAFVFIVDNEEQRENLNKCFEIKNRFEVILPDVEERKMLVTNLLSDLPNCLVADEVDSLVEEMNGFNIRKIEEVFEKLICEKIYINEQMNDIFNTKKIDFNDIELEEKGYDKDFCNAEDNKNTCNINDDIDLKTSVVEKDKQILSNKFVNIFENNKKNKKKKSKKVFIKDETTNLEEGTNTVNPHSGNIEQENKKEFTKMEVKNKRNELLVEKIENSDINSNNNEKNCLNNNEERNNNENSCSSNKNVRRVVSDENEQNCKNNIYSDLLSKPVENISYLLNNVKLGNKNGKNKTNEKFMLCYDDFKKMLKKNVFDIKNEIIRKSNVSFDDIGGYDTVKQTLREAVIWPLTYKETYKKLGIGIPKGIILYGPPGCAKTLLAKAISNESKMSFYSVKGSELESKYVGDTTMRIQDLFKKARAARPCIIFIDEIDAVVHHSISDASHSKKAVAAFLTEMDGLDEIQDVIVIGTTNRIETIDSAFKRPGRIDRCIEVGLPDEIARKKIFEIKLKKEINYKFVIDTEGMSGAEITLICQEAAMVVVRKIVAGRNLEFVTDDDLEEAIYNVKNKLRV